MAAALLAPAWAGVADNAPDRTNASPDDTVVVDGARRSVIDETGTPLGPTWGGSFLLGADADGRDVAVRLLYGARTSLFVGLAATLLTMVLAVAVALTSGYLRGRVDAVAGSALDVLWAFPVILIAIALGVALDRASILVPVAIIALVYVPYAARPLRTQVLALREREFVDAARVSGAGPAAGDVVGAAAQPGPHAGGAGSRCWWPTRSCSRRRCPSWARAWTLAASWGTMLDDGLERMTSAPHAWIAPGLMLLAAVLALNWLAERAR